MVLHQVMPNLEQCFKTAKYVVHAENLLQISVIKKSQSMLDANFQNLNFSEREKHQTYQSVPLVDASTLDFLPKNY